MIKDNIIFEIPFSTMVTATIPKSISKGVNKSELMTKNINVAKKPVAMYSLNTPLLSTPCENFSTTKISLCLDNNKMKI